MKILLKVKNSLRNETLRNGALFSLFSFVNRGFSFLLLLILANYITPAEYGFLSLFNTVVMVVGYFIALSTEGYLSVSYFRDGEDGLKQTFSCTFFTSLIIAFLFSAILFFSGNFISGKLNLPLNSLYIAIGICFFNIFSNLILNYYRLQKRAPIYGMLSCGNAALNFVISIILIRNLLIGWEGRIYAQLGCCILFGAIGFVFFAQNKFVRFPNIKHWKMMLLWGIPLIPHLATNFIRQGCDRYIINYFHNIEEVGLFSFAFNLTNIIIMVGMGFNDSNSVKIFEILGNKNICSADKRNLLKNQRKMMLKVYLLSTIVIVCLGTFLTPFALPKYDASIKYFIVLSMYGFFHCLYFLYTNFLFFYKKNKLLMSFTFFSSVLHLALSLIFTRYSLLATCLIYSLSQLLIVFLVRNYANKLIEKEMSLC
ncbi:oligosaccharide flippase family protein [Candidatus Saccharibacteria bacterium]|nr:oligosaccharide flippase family protein [Candidatus Saccharibacteria bacterium]